MDYRAIYDALDFFGHAWTIEILAALTEGPKRFSELQRAINLVHATTFNTALRRLVEDGQVSHPNDGDGVHYVLTPKGRRSLPSIIEFAENLRSWDESRNNRGTSAERRD